MGIRITITNESATDTYSIGTVNVDADGLYWFIDEDNEIDDLDRVVEDALKWATEEATA